jgi:uncharacterized protein YjdB
MRNIFKQGLCIVIGCLMACTAWATDATFTMSSIFDGSGLSFNVTSPVAATVSSNTSKSNAKTGKLGSDGHYFEIVLSGNTFTAASINGFINTTTTTGKNWAFQFSTDGGTNWSAEVTQANDGNKTAHDIQVGVTIPANANGFRVVRRAGTSTQVNSITLTLGEGGSVTPPDPVAVTGVSLNKNATTIAIGANETLTATITPANADNQAVTWSSNNTAVATVNQTGKVTGVSAGTATITVTTQDGNKTATCTVTVPDPSADPVAVTGVSLNKTSTSLTVGATETLTATVAPANATNQAVTWSSNNTAVASVDQNGKVTAVAAGTATITVTTQDGNKTATCTVTVSAAVTPTVPQSGLIIHVPEVYEDKLLAGGYNTPLTVVNGREYEVYYTERTADGDYPTFSTTLASEGKATGISGSTSKTENVGRDGDKWFQGTVYSHSECKNATDIDEFDFETKMIREHRLSKDNTYQFHVQGFDQFSLWGMDKKLDPKNGNQVFVVKIDGVEQATDASLYNTTAYTVRRYNMTTGEHLIEISTTCTGSNVCYMGGFSLRVAQEPRTKWLKGNDSTQVVLQTTSPKNVFYYTKYNSMGETRLVWEGQEATGIALSTRTQDALGDTLVLGGTANCPVGEYRYNVIAYYNGVETSRVKGKFRVASDIQATSEIDIDAYQNEEMDQITFKYYALSADDVQLTWPSGQPTGITGSGSNGKYIIGGTPNVTDALPKTFPFAITVAGADTTIQGKITVRALDYGQNAVLYLYKNNKAYVKDGVYKYLDGAGKYNLIARRAKEDGLRPAVQYANYKWVLISEDVDADNQEALALARGESDLPVLSMKSFSYTPGRLNWGEPNNGSLTMEEGRYITVQRADHPIFQALGKQRGDRIMVLDTVVGKGLMPVAVNFSGTLCLATARTRSIDDYYADGPEETFLHEVPSDMHGGRKYICLPIGLEGSNYLSSQGKKLIDETIKYLLGAQASITLPDLAITDFRIGNYVGRINDSENLILVPVLQSDSDLMKTAVPQITLASPLTHVTPAVSNEDGSVDFSNWHYGVRYTVSDYINTRSYDVLVQLYDPQGIDAVYTPGEWVNIYDMQGRKLTTTNEDIRQMALPTGVYIVVTENGTFKLTR